MGKQTNLESGGSPLASRAPVPVRFFPPSVPTQTSTHAFALHLSVSSSVRLRHLSYFWRTSVAQLDWPISSWSIEVTVPINLLPPRSFHATDFPEEGRTAHGLCLSVKISARSVCEISEGFFLLCRKTKEQKKQEIKRCAKMHADRMLVGHAAMGNIEQLPVFRRKKKRETYHRTIEPHAL
jgi:hypothetical protein